MINESGRGPVGVLLTGRLDNRLEILFGAIGVAGVIPSAPRGADNVAAIEIGRNVCKGGGDWAPGGSDGGGSGTGVAYESAVPLLRGRDGMVGGVKGTGEGSG